MNLPAYFRGSLKALGRSETWHKYFYLTRRGLKQSFTAPLLMMPCLYICGIAVQTELGRLREASEAPIIPLAAFAIIAVLYLLTFPVTAYILTMVFDKQDRFKPWVIVRHWTMFFTALIIAAIFGLYLLGIIPFALANLLGFVIYLGTLAIDIRLAQKIAGFEWGAAILAACIITAMGLAVVLAGVVQFGG